MGAISGRLRRLAAIRCLVAPGMTVCRLRSVGRRAAAYAAGTTAGSRYGLAGPASFPTGLQSTAAAEPARLAPRYHRLAVRALRRHGIGAVVLLDDLARFNADHGTRIVPMPLAIYLSMFEVHQRAPDRWVEMWLDKMKSCVSKLATAIEYAGSFRGDDVSQVITAACEKRPASQVLPLEAADFAAAQAGSDAARDARGRDAETARIVQHLA